jgi:hypothetical protein
MAALHQAADPVMPPGVLRFASLTAALHAGFQVCGHTADGYLVKIRTVRGWGLASVSVAAG